MGYLFQNSLSEFLTIVSLILLTIAYIYIKHIYSYWERRNIKYLPGTFPFGNFTENFLQKLSYGQIIQNIYKSANNSPFIGIFNTIYPALMICDPRLIRNVTIKDFQYFHDRGVYIDAERDPLSGHLFSLNGEKWKNLRLKLTPTFTSGKLKAMFSTLSDCGDYLTTYMKKCAKMEETIEVREIAARFTTDIIASVAFGINVNSIDNPDTDFRHFGRKVFKLNLKNGIRQLITFVAPNLLKILKLKSVDNDVEEFMTTIVRETLNYREKNNIIRKDFFQLLIQIRNSGMVQLDDQWETKILNDEHSKCLTLMEVAAQAYVFYLAGFETSSTVMSFCLYELAKNPKIQQKVQEEIDTILSAHNGKITYESISEMRYLEKCIDETLRLYPPVPMLNRQCTRTYNIPDTTVTIDKGTAIIIPIMALHRDPKYWSDPLAFQPERFDIECYGANGKTHLDRPYLPFGEGPRNCIGIRMGKMQTKVGLVFMLKQCNFQLGSTMKQTIDYSTTSIVLTSKDGIYLKVTERQKCM